MKLSIESSIWSIGIQHRSGDWSTHLVNFPSSLIKQAPAISHANPHVMSAGNKKVQNTLDDWTVKFMQDLITQYDSRGFVIPTR